MASESHGPGASGTPAQPWCADNGEAMIEDEKRILAVDYLKSWLGVPYAWGGDDFSGFDCSGLIVEVLQGVDVLPHNSDFRARDLYRRFAECRAVNPQAGDLIFWFINFMGDEIASHVEMLVSPHFCIGASGGGGSVRTIQDAVRYNAFVKLRPLTYRGGNYKIVNPYEE